jgi:hypothetical protein
MSSANVNVLFLGVARMAGYGIVIASYSHHSDIDLGAVRQMLEQPNMNMQPGKHYSFTVAQLAWHLIADDNGLIYIMICQQSYPQRAAHACLEEVQRGVSQFISTPSDNIS